MSEVRWTACQGKALLILSAVFIAGLASGMAAMHIFDGDEIIAAVEGVAQTAEEEYRQQSLMAVEKLEVELGLDPEQTQRVRVILDESIMAEAELLMEMRQIQQTGRERIIEVLRPDQRSEFEANLYPVSSR